MPNGHRNRKPEFEEVCYSDHRGREVRRKRMEGKRLVVLTLRSLNGLEDCCLMGVGQWYPIASG